MRRTPPSSGRRLTRGEGLKGPAEKKLELKRSPMKAKAEKRECDRVASGSGREKTETELQRSRRAITACIDADDNGTITSCPRTIFLAHRTRNIKPTESEGRS